MAAESLVLAQLLSLAGLLAGATEYCEIIRRRAALRHRADADRRAVEASGLQGLVRVFLADSHA